MKRDDLKKLGVADELIDGIMALHGQTVDKSKSDLATLKTETDAYKAQLEDASKQIETFKSLDIDGVKRQADEWKAKAEQAQTEAAAQVAKLKFDTALTGALSGEKAKNAKAVQALLDMNGLKFNEADGSIIGLKEQLEKIKSENDYLFDGGDPLPRIVTQTNNETVTTDAFTSAMRSAAGLK